MVALDPDEEHATWSFCGEDRFDGRFVPHACHGIHGEHPTVPSAAIACTEFHRPFQYLGLDAAATVTGFTSGAGDLSLLEFDLTESVEAQWDVKMLFLFMQITLANSFMVRTCLTSMLVIQDEVSPLVSGLQTVRSMGS